VGKHCWLGLPVPQRRGDAEATPRDTPSERRSACRDRALGGAVGWGSCRCVLAQSAVASSTGPEQHHGAAVLIAPLEPANGMSISRPSYASIGFFRLPCVAIFEVDDTDIVEFREVPMDLFVISIYYLGGFADALRGVVSDRLQELQVLWTEEPTEFSVRTEVEHWAGRRRCLRRLVRL